MTSPSSSPTSLEQMESRLAELELKLCGASLASSDRGNPNGPDVNSRLTNLMRLETDRRRPTPVAAASRAASDAAKADAKRLALHEEFRTIDRLLSELALSPLAGPAAAAGSGNNAPMAYRRMEILASADSMKRDMDLLARIRDLTYIGTKAPAGGASSSGGGDGDGSKIVNCPIVSSERYNLPSDPKAAERLERICFRVAKLNQRAAVASQRADEMLNSYGKIMMALSEKMVLAEEQIKG
eukprot:CAMPEP_0183722342 /NCGR_PEP_ID=MMETSP0737-20130205/14322_1 /TAXON_ID=385413 /ORGANISM="Thalassiosira miniscula, Strain CCMP1093" /LENGTH=240 /DNA_ID=CAMNT_0025952483 /DNA_START=119 /DNA_END=841 /DNA_ORIENTATION=-